MDLQSLEPLGRLVVLDFETTQAPPGSSTRLRPVEVAAILVEGGRVVDQLDTLINPGCPIDSFSRSIHGIGDRDVASAASFSEVWQALCPLLSGATVLAHNASFDSAVMRDEIQRLSLAPPSVEWWCTLRFARRLWKGEFPSFGLSALVRELALEGVHAHRAAADAGLALDLLSREVAAARQRLLSIEEIREHALHKSTACWPFPRQRYCPSCGA